MRYDAPGILLSVAHGTISLPPLVSVNVERVSPPLPARAEMNTLLQLNATRERQRDSLSSERQGERLAWQFIRPTYRLVFS